jgi:hypothetical protein
MYGCAPAGWLHVLLHNVAVVPRWRLFRRQAGEIIVVARRHQGIVFTASANKIYGFILFLLLEREEMGVVW